MPTCDINCHSVVETKSFVILLFEVLSSGEYDVDLKAKRATATKSAAPVMKDPAVVSLTPLSASNSGSNVSAHGDVDMRTGRPGAVVQPLVSAGNNGSADDKDYRQEIYRPGQDARHHGEPQHRRDWKRRSPQRTVDNPTIY